MKGAPEWVCFSLAIDGAIRASPKMDGLEEHGLEVSTTSTLSPPFLPISSSLQHLRPPGDVSLSPVFHRYPFCCDATLTQHLTTSTPRATSSLGPLSTSRWHASTVKDNNNNVQFIGKYISHCQISLHYHYATWCGHDHYPKANPSNSEQQVLTTKRRLPLLFP